jgi:hypothetical protein
MTISKMNLSSLELYEETKNMPSEERVAYLRKLVESVHKKYGFTPIGVTQNYTFSSSNALIFHMS